jgi:hypothetical protein
MILQKDNLSLALTSQDYGISNLSLKLKKNKNP